MDNSALAARLETLEWEVRKLKEKNEKPCRNLCNEEVVRIVKQARKDAFVRNRPNWEEEFNFLPPKNGLSTLCAEFILQNVDPNKRIQLSMTYPSIRGIEKSVPLEIEKLEITPSDVFVNNTGYVLGEILLIPESNSLDEEEINKINQVNSIGGFPWRSLKNEIVASGDVELGNRDDSFSESQMNEIMGELRSTFMRALEMYLNGRDKLNPIELLNKFEEESDKEMFDRQARDMFGILGGRYESLDKIYSMRDFFDVVKNGKSGKEDRLAEECPKSFEFMKNIVKHSRTENVILKKLLHPQESIPTFNQFAIFEKKNAKYSVHLPKYVNLRQAFKLLTSIIFGGRREIKVTHFGINGLGIVGLPVGFKVSAEELGVLTESNSKAYDKILSYSESDLLNGRKMLDHPITLDTFLPPRNGLSKSCVECILQNVDPNKRIQLSMAYPAIRKIEKSVPLEMEILMIYPSYLCVNNTRYNFGEILHIPEDNSLHEYEIKMINQENSFGGFPWRSLKNEVVAPGDVELENRDDSFLESQKNEIMEEFRRTFMRALEMYLNGRDKLNPIDLLNKFEEESDKEVFDREARNMFEILGDSSESSAKIYSMRDFFNEVRYGKSGQEDRLAEEYPKSFEFMKNIVESSRTRNSILEKLLYPQESIPTFNQFTIFENWEAKYTVHLPEHVNLRKAFKLFTSVIFGGRREIKVKRYHLDGFGIVGLPVGFKIRADVLLELRRWNSNAHYKVVFYADGVFLDENTQDILNLNIVKNCRHLVFYSREDYVETILENLNNDNIYLNFSSCIELLIEQWLKNSNRKLGSKLFIGLISGYSLKVISERLIRRGFVSCNVEGELSQSRLQYGDKQISLTKNDRSGDLPFIFGQIIWYPTFLIVEVVNT